MPPLAQSDLARLEAYINVSGPAARVTLSLAAVVLIWSYRHSEHREQRSALRVILVGVLTSLLLYVVFGPDPTQTREYPATGQDAAASGM